MQANGVAGQATHLGHLVPDVRVVGPTLEQVVEDLLGFFRLVLLEQQVAAGLLERIIVGVLPQQSVHPLLGVGQAVGGDVQVHLGQVVDDLVGRLGQQGRQVLPRLIQLAALDQGDGQAVAGRVQFRVFVEHGAEAFGGYPRGFLEHQLDAGAHQLVTQAVLDAAGWQLLGAVAGVGDTGFGHRVGQEEFRRLGVVAVLAHQALEHAWHGAWVVAGLFQVEDADAVGFLFVLPGEAALFLDGRRLGGHDRRHACVTGAGRRRDYAGEHRRHDGDLHALLGLDAAGEVALRQVRQFVGQHRGVLGLGGGIEEEAAVDADDAAGGGEGVELRAVEQHEFQAPVLQLAGLGQAVDTGFDIVFQLRVVELRHLAAQQAQPGAAELVFLFRGDDGRAGVPQRRQVVGHDGWSEKTGKRQQSGAQKIHALGSLAAKA
ncbi:hypothetical protein D9M69_449460 [compost metagenome]